RRGYLDFLLDLTNAFSSYSPQFYDMFAKVSHQIGSRHKIALEGLLSGDHLEYLDTTDPNDQVISTYGNGYLWVNWQTVWNANLFSQTVVSKGKIWRDRDGVDIRRDKLISFQAKDRRRFNAFQFKQDWTYDAGNQHQVKWGISLKQHQSNYQYSNLRLVQDVADPASPSKVVNRYAEQNTASTPAGIFLNLYTSHQFRMGERFAGIAGGRFGYITWSNDRYLDPRLNLSYQLGTRTALRSAWGIFHQPQGIEQLYVEDGDQRYYQAERSRHFVLGLDHAFTNGATLKVDLYNKQNSNVRPRYLSLGGEAAAFFPELDENRVFWKPESVHAKGAEFSLRKENGRYLNGLLSYTLSQVSESVDGVFIPKSQDQRHAFLLDLDIKPRPRLHVNMSWQYHTGWRYSDVDFDITYQQEKDVLYDVRYGALNGQRYPAYHKLNLRLSQVFNFGRQSLVAYLEIQNVYNRKNVRLYSFTPQVQSDGSVEFLTRAESWLPRLPTLGLKWDISH
ncbi:MAG: TonB-dependent receptor plug domain-containing protein, partial [Rhodothermales bacterium]